MRMAARHVDNGIRAQRVTQRCLSDVWRLGNSAAAEAGVTAGR